MAIFNHKTKYWPTDHIQIRKASSEKRKEIQKKLEIIRKRKKQKHVEIRPLRYYLIQAARYIVVYVNIEY